MDLIYVRTDGDGVTTSGYLTNYEATFDVSTDLDYVTNKFEITTALPTSKEGLLWAENEIRTIIYVEGTEYGGEISGSEISIADNTIKYTGRTVIHSPVLPRSIMTGRVRSRLLAICPVDIIHIVLDISVLFRRRVSTADPCRIGLIPSENQRNIKINQRYITGSRVKNEIARFYITMDDRRGL